jgi:hypothetical protein
MYSFLLLSHGMGLMACGLRTNPVLLIFHSNAEILCQFIYQL